MLNFTIGYWLRSAIPVEGYLGWGLWLLSLETIWRRGDHRIRLRVLGLTLAVELIDTKRYENTQKKDVSFTDGMKSDENAEEMPVEKDENFTKWAVKIHKNGVRLVIARMELYDRADNSFVLSIPEGAPVTIDPGTRIAFGGPDDALYVDVTGHRPEGEGATRFFGKVVRLDI